MGIRDRGIGAIDQTGILVLGDIVDPFYTIGRLRKKATYDQPKTSNYIVHGIGLSPVCAYVYNLKTQNILAEVPRLGRGWGKF